MEHAVLFLIPSLKPGGAEHQTAQQFNALKEKGWQVSLCALHPDLAIKNEFHLSGDDFLVLSLSSSVLNLKTSLVSPAAIKKLRRFCKDRHITHIIASLPLAHWYGRVIKILLPSLKLITYHRSMQYNASPLNTTAKKIFNNFQSWLARRNDDISICISNAVKENISAHFHLSRPVVIYNTVIDHYDRIKKLAKVRPPSGKIRLVIPGRLHSSKGHRFFIDTYVGLPTELQEKTEVCFLGGGPLESELKAYISQIHYEDKILVTGFLHNESLLLQMFDADLVLIPSIHEGFGNIAVEALMLGKTILASDSGGLKEIIMPGKNGYQFRSGDQKDLAEKLTSLIVDFPASLMDADTIRKDYLERFSFESHMNKLTDTIQKA
jgi:glycosyltransferase involved in cell wall biosynthesis